MDLELKGKVALVTGGSRGIGRAIALGLADEGCHVAICARNGDGVTKVADEITKKGVSAVGITADVTNPADIGRVMQTVIQKWGTIHILINNVGGGGRWGSAVVEETPEQVWSEAYAKNAVAATRFTMLGIPYMRKQKWGRVVTIGSILGRQGFGRPWYSMAKSAETNLMKALAATRYLARDGITFNSIEPGVIDISGTQSDKEARPRTEEYRNLIDRHFPLGRAGSPEEVAHVVVFVCSAKAALVNGASIAVDGAEGNRDMYDV